MTTGPEKLLQLTDVEMAYSRGSSKERRKYLTLIEETQTARRGGLGETVRVRAMTGERLACKKLLLPDRKAFGSAEAYETEIEHRERAFREEYDALCRLSNFKGFVKARAFGRINDMPLILMEWVDGMSVGNVAKLVKRTPDAPGADPLVVAQIGRDVFHLLARLESETELFVHRDLSASNIMIRTSDRPIQTQIADGYFDVCFIDFGSAATLRVTDGAFTTDTRILRGATPGYAPPEMLSNDLPGLDELRKSTKIDVYAACSVLYEMLCGHLPFDVANRTGAGSDYLFKMMNDPAPSGFEEGTAERLLADILCKGICATQDARCSSYAMFKMLEFYITHFDENTGRSANGKELISLNPRSIDRPDFRTDQIALSNPLASGMRSEVRAVSVDATVETALLTSDDAMAVSAASRARAAARENYSQAARNARVSTPAPVSQPVVSQPVSYAPQQATVRQSGNVTPQQRVYGNQNRAAGGAAWQQPYPNPAGARPARPRKKLAAPKIALVMVVLAAIAVALVVAVLVIPRVGGSESSQESASKASSASSAATESSSASGSSASGPIETWSGKLVSTSSGNSCYGADGHPLTIEITDEGTSGSVTCNLEVLYHAHNRATQSGNVQSNAGDTYLTIEDVMGTRGDGRLSITVDLSDEMGRDSSLIIECKQGPDSATIEATVTSVFSGAKTEDVYSLKKQ